MKVKYTELINSISKAIIELNGDKLIGELIIRQVIAPYQVGGESANRARDLLAEQQAFAILQQLNVDLGDEFQIIDEDGEIMDLPESFYLDDDTRSKIKVSQND